MLTSKKQTRERLASNQTRHQNKLKQIPLSVKFLHTSPSPPPPSHSLPYVHEVHNNILFIIFSLNSIYLLIIGIDDDWSHICIIYFRFFLCTIVCCTIVPVFVNKCLWVYMRVRGNHHHHEGKPNNFIDKFNKQL